MTRPFSGSTTGRALRGFACVVTAVVTAVVIAGCASVLEGAGSGGGATDQPGSTTYDHASGPQDVLVSVKSDGGYSPVEFNLRNTAEFTLLGDGTAVVLGPMIELYPGPAIDPLQSSPLTEQQIQDLYTAADQAGLLDQEIDFGEPTVTDMQSTTVSITVGDRTVRQSAYALGFSDDPAAGLSESEIAAREALQGFIDTAHAMVDDETEPYVPTAIAVFRLNPAETTADPELAQEPLVWPIATAPPPSSDPARACAVVTGGEAAQLLEALQAANELTPWLVGSDPPAYFAFRPLLPDDPGCEQ